MAELRDLKNGDVITFNTVNHEFLGNPELVTIAAFCDYDTAVMLDPSLPSTINRIIIDASLEDYNPNTRNYLVYRGTNGVRAIDTTWVVEESIELPNTTTLTVTMHDVTLSTKGLALQALNNLSIRYTVD